MSATSVNFSLQSVYIDPPLYLAILNSLLALACIAAFIALVIGLTRLDRHVESPRNRAAFAFHSVLVSVCLAYFVGLGLYWLGSDQGIASYEKTLGRSAPLVVAAFHRDLAIRMGTGVAAAAIVAWSFVVWCGAPGRRQATAN